MRKLVEWGESGPKREPMIMAGEGEENRSKTHVDFTAMATNG